MNPIARRIPTLLLLLLSLASCGPETESPFLPGAVGDFLGQVPPGEDFAVFGRDLITFGTHEHHLSISPDGSEMFFVIADRFRRHHTLILVRRSGDEWYRPQVAAFSGSHNDFAPTYAPDGNTLYFCSNRPVPGAAVDRTDVNIWRVTRTTNGWSEPSPLPAPLNDLTDEYNPTVTADGTIYFQDGDGTGVDIYVSRLESGEYTLPEKVEGIGSPYPEIGPLVTPDGGTLIFSSGRPSGEGELDFWVSFLGDDGSWTEPVNMGEKINTPSFDAIITMSPDGEYFFFTNFIGISLDRIQDVPYEELVRALGGPENGDGTIYWISSSILDGLRGESL